MLFHADMPDTYYMLTATIYPAWNSYRVCINKTVVCWLKIEANNKIIKSIHTLEDLMNKNQILPVTFIGSIFSLQLDNK